MLNSRHYVAAVAILLVPLSVYLVTAGATEAKPPAAECRWATGPITLDGTANEPAWTAAQVIDGFAVPWLAKADRPTPSATRARLLWDRQYLYFTAEMADADLFADITEHDGDTWNNDVFEVFLRPAADKPGYYEFQVTPAKTVFDSFFPKRDLKTISKQSAIGDFHVESAVKLRGTLNRRDDRDTGWTVEGRIPWTDFLRTGGRPVAGETWDFALCRYDYVNGRDEPELSTTAAIGEKRMAAFFHQYEDYTPLTFVGPKGVAPPPGLDEYTPVTTSTVVGSPEPPLPYRMTRLYPDFSPALIVNARVIPGSDQMLVSCQDRGSAATTILRITDDPKVRTEDAVTFMETPENGTAYDIAFHPKFAENGYVYIGWNAEKKKGDKGRVIRVTRYTMKPKPPYTLDESSAVSIVDWMSMGHNGAAVCFGNDGMLYVTTGDGTSDSDGDIMGQNTDTLLSKLLRLDVDHPTADKPYSIPKDNPFVDDKRFAPETYAYGLRNPWRICCDEKTGRIWIGNNGQDVWETAYLVRPRDNYGWSVFEGSHPFYPERKLGPTPHTPPTIEHNHAEFRSLTGGIVYYGDPLPELNGVYVYGDHSTGRTWGMLHDGEKPVWHKELARGPHHITAYTTNTRGQLVICDHGKAGEGGLYTLTPTPKNLPPSTFPKKLSESGLFESVKDHRMKSGVIPYSVNAPFWSDGAYKERYIALPQGGKITYGAKRGWDFPDKTVLVKSFALEEKPGDPATRKWIETRFLTKQETEWFGYSYIWNDAGTDAELVEVGGQDKTFGDQVWHYPSRTECMVCHTRAAKFVLGIEHLQLNKSHDYGNGYRENQLALLDRLGLFENPPNWAAACRAEMTTSASKKHAQIHAPQADQRLATVATLADLPGALPKLADPYDPAENLDARARSWIHANCANCHIEAGGGNAQMELEFTVAARKMKLFGEKPLHETFGLPDAKLVAPGDPHRSVLLKRADIRGRGQMPPLSSNRVDEAGVALLREWIESLEE